MNNWENILMEPKWSKEFETRVLGAMNEEMERTKKEQNLKKYRVGFWNVVFKFQIPLISATIIGAVIVIVFSNLKSSDKSKYEMPLAASVQRSLEISKDIDFFKDLRVIEKVEILIAVGEF